MVFGWVPAISIYFRDPDGHSVELIAMLPDQPRPDLGVLSWENEQSAVKHWRLLDGATLLPDVIAGVKFVNGAKAERNAA